MDNDQIRLRIAAWLKESRIRAGMDIDEAAEALQITPWMLGQFESGAGPVPLKVLARAPRAYGVSVEELIEVLQINNKEI